VAIVRLTRPIIGRLFAPINRPARQADYRGNIDDDLPLHPCFIVIICSRSSGVPFVSLFN
jgi:hypothetical protein